MKVFKINFFEWLIIFMAAFIGAFLFRSVGHNISLYLIGYSVGIIEGVLFGLGFILSGVALGTEGINGDEKHKPFVSKVLLIFVVLFPICFFINQIIFADDLPILFFIFGAELLGVMSSPFGTLLGYFLLKLKNDKQ